METLVVVGHHRNHQQYHGRNRRHGSARFGSYGSPPSGGFRGINCRTFHSGEGLIPNPFKPCSTKTPVTKKAICSSSSLKTPSPSVHENPKILKRIVKSSSVPIPTDIKFENSEPFRFPELWAGPAYSNSPPPSSLPIPKFSLRPKRTVSLELDSVSSEIHLHRLSKSAPSSPTRKHGTSPSDLFDITDSATKTLCRILNLDVTDDDE